MFAVVRTGGKQYRVAPGDKIVVEKLDGEPVHHPAISGMFEGFRDGRYRLRPERRH